MSDIFTSLMSKVTDLISWSDHVFHGGIHQTRLLLAKMKWFICDVIPDSHPIGGMTE